MIDDLRAAGPGVNIVLAGRDLAAIDREAYRAGISAFPIQSFYAQGSASTSSGSPSATWGGVPSRISTRRSGPAGSSRAPSKLLDEGRGGTLVGSPSSPPAEMTTLRSNLGRRLASRPRRSTVYRALDGRAATGKLDLARRLLDGALGNPFGARAIDYRRHRARIEVAVSLWLRIPQRLSCTSRAASHRSTTRVRKQPRAHRRRNLISTPTREETNPCFSDDLVLPAIHRVPERSRSLKLRLTMHVSTPTGERTCRSQARAPAAPQPVQYYNAIDTCWPRRRSSIARDG